MAFFQVRRIGTTQLSATDHPALQEVGAVLVGNNLVLRFQTLQAPARVVITERLGSRLAALFFALLGLGQLQFCFDRRSEPAVVGLGISKALLLLSRPGFRRCLVAQRIHLIKAAICWSRSSCVLSDIGKLLVRSHESQKTQHQTRLALVAFGLGLTLTDFIISHAQPYSMGIRFIATLVKALPRLAHIGGGAGIG